MHFPGTLDVCQMHYIAVVQDLCRSILSMGSTKILLLNGHGGNDVPVRTALREVKTELAGRQGLHVLYTAYWMLATASIREIRESELGASAMLAKWKRRLCCICIPSASAWSWRAAMAPSKPRPIGRPICNTPSRCTR